MNSQKDVLLVYRRILDELCDIKHISSMIEGDKLFQVPDVHCSEMQIVNEGLKSIENLCRSFPQEVQRELTQDLHRAQKESIEVKRKQFEKQKSECRIFADVSFNEKERNQLRQLTSKLERRLTEFEVVRTDSYSGFRNQKKRYRHLVIVSDFFGPMTWIKRVEFLKGLVHDARFRVQGITRDEVSRNLYPGVGRSMHHGKSLGLWYKPPTRLPKRQPRIPS